MASRAAGCGYPRACSLVAGAALVLSGMRPDDAIALLREKRSQAVLCNPAFAAWLRDLFPLSPTPEENPR